jgi:hypothetical protein
LHGGKRQTIYFFAKVRWNARGEPTALPEDRVVRENPRNGFLTISKKTDDPPDEDRAAAAKAGWAAGNRASSDGSSMGV